MALGLVMGFLVQLPVWHGVVLWCASYLAACVLLLVLTFIHTSTLVCWLAIAGRDHVQSMYIAVLKFGAQDGDLAG